LVSRPILFAQICSVAEISSSGERRRARTPGADVVGREGGGEQERVVLDKTGVSSDL
jgi:hypothetical protein